MTNFTTHGTIDIRDPAEVNVCTNSANFEYLTRAHQTITFRHPGYPQRHNDLFTIPALDHRDGGIHHALALCMCTIMADNKEGFLALTVGGSPLGAALDDVLPARDYYFHVPPPDGTPPDTATSSSPYKWPVVTCFADWEFPETLPEYWTRSLPIASMLPTASMSTSSMAVRIRDVSCRISQHTTSTEAAHLCPEAEIDWFTANNMSQYKQTLDSDQKHLLKDPANTLLLRSDIHKFFDDRGFVFFPKGPDGCLVVHMLKKTGDLTRIYHNIQAHHIHCRREYVFARLAWAIFPFLATTFLSHSTPRTVVKVDENTGERSVTEFTRPTQLQLRAASLRGRSPKKRQRGKESEGTDSLESNSDLGRKRPRHHYHSQDPESQNQNINPSPSLGESASSSEKLAAPSRLLKRNKVQPSEVDILRMNALKVQRRLNHDIIEREKGRKRDIYDELRDHGFEIISDTD